MTLPGGTKEAEALVKDITSEQYQFAYVDATAQPGKVWDRGWDPAQHDNDSIEDAQRWVQSGNGWQVGCWNGYTDSHTIWTGLR